MCASLDTSDLTKYILSNIKRTVGRDPVTIATLIPGSASNESSVGANLNFIPPFSIKMN